MAETNRFIFLKRKLDNKMLPGTATSIPTRSSTFKTFFFFGGMLLLLGACSLESNFQSNSSENETEESETLGVPQDAVAFFNAASCPEGWTAYDLAKGRAILGAGSGNTDANGEPLTARTFGGTGGREYTTGIPATSEPGTSGLPATGPLAVTSTNLYAPYTPGSNTLPMEGISSDTNIPPAVFRLACRALSKTSVPTSISVPRNENSCAEGWSQDSVANSRTLFGTGSGNKDPDNLNLTPRTLGTTSGQEYTVLSASNEPLTSTTPGPTLTIGVGVSMYASSGTPVSQGVVEDSNMPPFISLPYCSPASSQPSLPTKTVMAFALSTCPEGWTNFGAGAGRFIFGSGAGNVDQAGVALTSRAVFTTGGVEYTPGYSAMSAPPMARTSSPNPNSFIGATTGTVNNSYAAGPPDTTLAGVKADSNLPPYVVLTWCTVNH